jgi:hypothetical protein
VLSLDSDRKGKGVGADSPKIELALRVHVAAGGRAG